MSWYWYLAFKQLFPSGRGFSFFACVAIFGVMLGVAVLVVVLSVMNGFGEMMKETVHKTTGDVKITAKGDIIYEWEGIVEKLEGLDIVEAVAPYTDGVVMMKHKDKPMFPMIKGVDYEMEPKVSRVEEFMDPALIENLDDESIIMGVGAASGLGASEGSVVEIYTPLMLKKLKDDEVLLPRELRVAGTFETGHAQLDRNMVIVSMRLLQELYGMDNSVHGMTVKLSDGVDPFIGRGEIEKVLPVGMEAKNWLEANEQYLFVLKMEKTMMFFIILFVILVASFSIASSLMTTVVRKTREIGVLGAMGARASQVLACFCIQGFIIGAVGTLMGLGMSLLALAYRNNIVHTLLSILEQPDMVANFYQFTEVPASVQGMDLVIICGAAVLITTLAGLLPAVRAGRIKPAEALRSE